MATVVNFMDTTLQAAAARGVNLATADIQLLPSAPLFKVNADGTITPETITFTATLVDLEAPAVDFNGVGGQLANVAAKSVSLAGASMPGTSATVIASVTVNGKLYTKSCTINKLQDGAPGTSTPGARGAGHYYASGSAWTDALANVSVPSPKVVGDVVTISSGTFVMEKRWTGSAWVDNGVVIDGKVIVPQSITAGTIDTRGLSIRDSAGNVILAAGSALAADYAAAGTKNTDLAPAIAAAATSTFTAAPGLMFDFDVDYSGWYGWNGATLSPGAGFITLKSGNSDPMLMRDNLNFVGGQYDKIRMRIKRTAGTGWDGTLFYSNQNHGESASYCQQIADATVTGQYVVIEWDMAKSAVPADWNGLAVTHLRIDLGASAQDVFDIDWIAIGKYAAAPSVGAVDAARAAADAAQASLNNMFLDGVISRAEKVELVRLWPQIDGEHTRLLNMGNAYGVDYSTYHARFVDYSNFLLNMRPYWTDFTQDTTIDSANYTGIRQNYANAKKDFENAIAAKAATMADATGLNIAIGKNMLANTAPNSKAGYNFANASGLALEGGGTLYLGDTQWSPIRKCVYLHMTGTPAANAIVDLYNDANGYIPVTAKKRYEFGVSISAHRCKTQVRVGWFDVNKAFITYTAGTTLTDNGAAFTQRPFPRSVLFDKAPDNAAYARVSATVITTGQADPYIFTSQWFMGEATDAQTVFSNWSEGAPSDTRAIGYAGDLDATKGAPAGTNVGNRDAQTVSDYAYAGQLAYNDLPNKLAANAGNILRAPITITTGGGVVVGSLTYDASSGQRGGGTGVAITPYGIIGHNGTKYTLAFDASTGNATFGGSIESVNGTFGALRIAPYGFIASGNFDGSWAWPTAGGGFLIHANGLLFGNRNDASSGFFSIGSNGVIEAPGLSYSGRQLRLDSPLIINPVQQPFSTSITNNLNTYTYTAYRQSTDVFGGVYKVTVGGTSSTNTPNHSWSVNGPWPCWLVSNGSPDQMQLHVNPKGGQAIAGDEAYFFITCVTSLNGNSQTATVEVDFTAS